jgi:hypothetical protein
MQVIRPLMTIRGDHTNRRARWTISYAYANGQGTAVPHLTTETGNMGGTNGAAIAGGAAIPVSDVRYAAGNTAEGRSRFYDPNSGTWMTAYLYDLWVGPPTGSGGYGITFWSNSLLTVADTSAASVLPRLGISTANYDRLVLNPSLGTGVLTGMPASTFPSIGTIRRDISENIIGYWDAVQFGGTQVQNQRMETVLR